MTALSKADDNISAFARLGHLAFLNIAIFYRLPTLFAAHLRRYTHLLHYV
jgi:hypothetical protein